MSERSFQPRALCMRLHSAVLSGLNW
jgi:hypothetical protein